MSYLEAMLYGLKIIGVLAVIILPMLWLVGTGEDENIDGDSDYYKSL